MPGHTGFYLAQLMTLHPHIQSNPPKVNWPVVAVGVETVVVTQVEVLAVQHTSEHLTYETIKREEALLANIANCHMKYILPLLLQDLV